MSKNPNLILSFSSLLFSKNLFKKVCEVCGSVSRLGDSGVKSHFFSKRNMLELHGFLTIKIIYFWKVEMLRNRRLCWPHYHPVYNRPTDLTDLFGLSGLWEILEDKIRWAKIRILSYLSSFIFPKIFKNRSVSLLVC